MAPIVAGGALATLVAAGCGGPRQDADEHSGTFPMAVEKASFASFQRLSSTQKMTITVRNLSQKTVPVVAVSLMDPRHRTSAQAFSDVSNDAQLASRSRPIWIIDQGPAGGDTAYSNTWALGALPPQATRTFRWSVTPARPGHYRILYRVAAGLDGKAKAVTRAGKPVTGEFDTTITTKPRQATVDPAGNVVEGG